MCSWLSCCLSGLTISDAFRIAPPPLSTWGSRCQGTGTELFMTLSPTHTTIVYAPFTKYNFFLLCFVCHSPLRFYTAQPPYISQINKYLSVWKRAVLMSPKSSSASYSLVLLDALHSLRQKACCGPLLMCYFLNIVYFSELDRTALLLSLIRSRAHSSRAQMEKTV